MQFSVFNSLTVVDSPSAALALGVGTNFLFSDIAPGVNSQQGRSIGDPGANRVQYWTRIAKDKAGGPYSLPSNIELNFTQQIQPVTAGGPFPPCAGSYEVYSWQGGDSIKNPTVENTDPTTPVPYTSINFPDDGVLKGQGATGYVPIFDILE